MSLLSNEEKQALRQSKGLLAGTRQWSMPRLRAPIRRTRKRGPLFAIGLLFGVVVAVAFLVVAFGSGWL